MGKGIGGHHSSAMETDEWLTPPEIIKALGPFDLDPCFSDPRPWDTAKDHIGMFGLESPWSGRVWLNPPYGQQTAAWLHRLANHGVGTALIFARTETEMFFRYVWGKATAVLFLRGRLHFYRPDGTKAEMNAGGPSVLVAYGEYDAMKLKESGLPGIFLRIQQELSI